jgi:hypothetical protein
MTDSAGLNDRGTDHGTDPGTNREAAWSSSADQQPAGEADLRKLAQDWITLWQSELSAMAADRELQESWQATMGLWAGVATAMLNATFGTAQHGATNRHDRNRQYPGRQHSGPEPAAGTKAAAAAPDARDAEIERLARHIAALEARLGELERSGRPRRPVRRKR